MRLRDEKSDEANVEIPARIGTAAKMVDGSYVATHYLMTGKSQRLQLKKGTKYYITFYSYRYSYQTAAYKIRIKTYSGKNFETEPNNSKSKANSVKKDVWYTGSYLDSYASSVESDYYVFKAPKTGYYQVTGVGKTGDGGMFRMYVGSKLKAEFTAEGINKRVTSKKIKLKKGQKMYIQTNGYWATPGRYMFKISQ